MAPLLKCLSRWCRSPTLWLSRWGILLVFCFHPGYFGFISFCKVGRSGHHFCLWQHDKNAVRLSSWSYQLMGNLESTNGGLLSCIMNFNHHFFWKMFWALKWCHFWSITAFLSAFFFFLCWHMLIFRWWASCCLRRAEFSSLQGGKLCCCQMRRIRHSKDK